MPGVGIGVSPFLRHSVGPTPIGTIISNNFTSADWTVIGSGFTFNGTKAVIANGADDFTNIAWYNKYFNDLQDCTFTADVKVLTPNVNGIGIGFLNFTFNPTVGQIIGQLNTDPLYATRLWLSNAATGTAFKSNTSPSIGTISTNDIIRVTASYVNRLVTITGKNITTSGPTQTYSFDTGYSYPFNSTFFFTSSMRFAIWNVGATSSQEIISYSITTNQKKNINTLLVGDSKFSGSGASNYAHSVCGLAASERVELSAGPGDTTDEVISRLNEIIAYNPKNVILWIGCNDVRFGGGAAHALTNILTINSTLAAAGITVYNCLSAPENTQDVTPLNTLITANCSRVIDLYTPLWSGAGTGLHATYNCGDGVHLNDAGYALVKSTIHSQYPSIL